MCIVQYGLAHALVLFYHMSVLAQVDEKYLSRFNSKKN
jgi:hypothetical protein